MFSKRLSKLALDKLCDATTNYSQLRKVELNMIGPSNIGCLLQKSPNLESLIVEGWDWNEFQSEDAAALVLPPYGTKLLNIRDIHLEHLNIGDKGVSTIAELMKALPHLRHVHLDSNHIGDKGVEKLSQLLQDSIFEKLSLNDNGIGDNGASAVADLMKALPRLRHVYLSRNHIGGTGAALLWNQSIHKCCNLSLHYNIIGDDRPDVFISALNGTVNSGYKGNKSCQLKVSLTHNRLLCSDLIDIDIIRKRLPKRVTLITGDDCTDKMLYHHFLSYSYRLYDARLQWISYAVCTFHIFHSTRTKRWGLLYFFCCLTFFILSSYNYLVQVDYFILIVSFLGSLIVAGRLIFHVSLKLLSKQWAGLLSSQ